MIKNFLLLPVLTAIYLVINWVSMYQKPDIEEESFVTLIKENDAWKIDH